MRRPLALLGRAALTLSLVGAAVLVWLVGTATDADALTCGPATASRAAVAVVVDFGESAPDGTCISISRNDSGGTNLSGIDALKSAGYVLRIDGGFLCAIDGVPATGCARNSGFDGWYWRYFKAEPGKDWRYSSSGFGYRLTLVNGCAAEGWVWSNSPDASVTPRGGAPSLNCPTQPAPTTTRVPATTMASPPQTSPSSGGGTAPGVGGAGAIRDPDGVNGIVQPDTSGAAGPASGAGNTAASGTVAGPDGASPGSSSEDRATPRDQVAEAADGGSTEAGDGSGSPRSIGSSDRSETAISARRAKSESAGPGSIVGSVIAGVLVAGLVLFVALRARSRRAVGQA